MSEPSLPFRADHVIDAYGGQYVSLSDHERALKDTGFIDRHGRRIYEGDKVNFSTRGTPHGPEREDYANQEVWWDADMGVWTFGRYVEGPGLLHGIEWGHTIGDGIEVETFEVVS